MSELRRVVRWSVAALAVVTGDAARASDAAPPAAARPSRTVFGEVCAFVPDPIQAPASRQFEAGMSLSRGKGPFVRVRAGGAMRSLGGDVLGLVEGGFGSTSPRSFVKDVAVGIGARQQFTAGDLYVVQDDGTVRRQADLGTTLLLATLSGGVGWDLRVMTGQPLHVLVGPRVQLTLPQRGGGAIELGLGGRVGWTF
ncbi:MAG: hypothetical protein RLZZ299_197 [Pseudomonadota bacterium]